MLLVIDGNNLAFRAHHKFEKLRSKDGRSTGIMYGFFRILHSHIARFKPGHVVVSFDTKQCKLTNFRSQLLPTYKAARKPRVDFDYASFNRQLRMIRRMLLYLNIPVIWDKKGLGYESDDYIAWAALTHKGKVLIDSSDKDFSQLVCRRIKIFNPSKECYITVENCKEKLGWEPHECVDYLSLLGDNSDCIPGYKGMGPVKIREFLDKWGSIENYLKNATPGTYKHLDHDALLHLAKLNRALIDLVDHTPNIKEVPIVYGKGKIQKQKLRNLFHRFSFMSFKDEEFINTFKKLKPW